MHLSTLRILDASLNRAAEGLRVVEDYARFVLEDRFLTRTTKESRHKLAEVAARFVPAPDRRAARDTTRDVGTAISTPTESTRGDAWGVCTASLKRVEQALRSLEEYGKLIDQRLAAECEQLRYGVYTIEKALGATTSSVDSLVDKRLCVLVDGCSSEASFSGLVDALVDAGGDAIQLRDKSLCDRELLSRARVLVAATRGAGVLAIVNDRADIAAAARADGVHLGQHDLSLADARAIVGPRALVGVSTHAIEQARQAVLDGASYLGLGPTFPSQTKSFDAFPGLEYLRQVADEIALPAFAIGGLTTENLPQVLESGAKRIAVSGVVTNSEDPARVVRALKQSLEDEPPTPVGG